MGQVYKARDKSTEEIFALKFLHPDADAGARARLRVEATEQATLNHPNVVRLLEFMSYEEHDFIVMEYVDGGSLSDADLDLEIMLDVFAGICSGLECIHRQGLVHRDLKPENILLTSDKIPKIADLGVARRVDQDLGLTRMGQIIGTTRYIAPEQVLQSGVTQASDLYSVGVMLFEAVTGRVPFDADSEFALLNAHIKDIPPALRTLKPGAPVALEQLVASLLEKSPENRPRSAGQVRESLLACLDELRNPTAAEPDARPTTDVGLEDLSQVILAMDHQIWNPMNGVLGMAQLLKDAPLSVTHKQYLQALVESADALKGALRDLLDFARLRTGKLRLDPVPTDLRGLIKNVQATSDRVLGHVDVSVPDLVLVDPLRLHQILSALVAHALRSSRTGVVSLRVQRDHDEPGKVALSFLLNHDGVIENVNELFLPRLDAHGVGFGLFLVSQLVTALGGRCWAQSFPGRGSAYTVTLTLDVCGTMPASESGPVAARILLADDLKINLVIVKAMLERLGHIVSTAMDGEEAVRALQTDTFDLVLMDMVMPGMDGLEATRQIREHERVKNLERTPIIALTALSQGDYASEALAAGMDGVLGKPVEEDSLVRVLAEHVRHRETPVLAPYDLAELKKRLGGSEKHVGVMLDMFLEVYPGQLAALETAIRDGNLGEVADLAGHLAGSLESIAAAPGAVAAKNLQQLAREGRQEAALHARRELVTQVERLLEALQARVPAQ